MNRVGTYSRKTNETQIDITFNIDGKGKANIDTGIGFFDHMLNNFARHGLFDLDVKVKGDLFVDCHHTIEDTGIALGIAIKQALGDKKSIKRYGSVILPMDESLVLCSLDLSGRPYLNFDAEFTVDKVGEFDTEMVKEFFRAVAFNAGITLHIKVLYGENDHHKIEGIFKCVGRALKEAINIEGNIIPSSKGII